MISAGGHYLRTAIAFDADVHFEIAKGLVATITALDGENARAYDGRPGKKNNSDLRSGRIRHHTRRPPQRDLRNEQIFHFDSKPCHADAPARDRRSRARLLSMRWTRIETRSSRTGDRRDSIRDRTHGDTRQKDARGSRTSKLTRLPG